MMNVQGVKNPGRALRVGRLIAARYLAAWRSRKVDGIDPRAVTEDRAREVFGRFSGLQSWPTPDLKLACKAASIYITRERVPLKHCAGYFESVGYVVRGRPEVEYRGGSEYNDVALFRALGGR